jgi:hypothetical protein
VRARTFAAVAGAILACAPIGCVGDDTVAVPGLSAPVQGGSGPPPSSYEGDATIEDATGEDATLTEAGEDAVSPALDGSADSTVDGAGPADAGGRADASAAADGASADAGDGA